MSMSREHPRPPSAHRVLVRAGLVSAAVVVALGLTEIGFRQYAAPYSRAEFERGLVTVQTMQRVGQVEGEQVISATEGRILHPYYAWEILSESLEVQADYEAALEATAETRSETFEVWVIGGSVARYFVIPHNGAIQSGAKRFAEVLQADPRLGGQRVVVKGYGRIAMKQPQQSNLVAFHLALGMLPDLVVNLDGANEVGLGNENVGFGTHPVYPAADMWALLATAHEKDEGSMGLLVALWENRRAHERLTRFALDSGLLWSRAFAWWIENRLRANQARYHDIRTEYHTYVGSLPNNLSSRGISTAGHEDRVPEILERAWYESSLSLDALCRARGIAYLHVLQPTLHDAGSKPLTQDEIEAGAATDGWVEGCRFGYPRLRAAGERLRARGIHFADASRLFAEVAIPIYYDSCHYNVPGNYVLGEFVAKAYLAGLDGE